MKHGFLQDDKGNYSIMRLMCSIIVVIGTACFASEIIYMMYVHNYDHHLVEIASFVLLGLGGKAAQKVTEKQTP